LLLTGMDSLYGDKVYEEINKRREAEAQSRSQAGVTITGSSNNGGSSGGGS
jgi:hypothetical protein